MKLDVRYPKETSSNGAQRKGLSDPNEESWTPEGDDDSPSVTVIVNSDEDKYIESVTVLSADNVASVTVVVEKKDGTQVCYLSVIGIYIEN